MKPRIFKVLWAAITFFAFLQIAAAANSSAEQWITYQGNNGATVYLRDDRKPALYTGNFGDCLGGSLINVTRFDAAYYADNMTVLFHLAGNTGLANESLMMYIGVYAYGQSRFDLTFDPCGANINSLCPANSSVPIQASGIIPIAQSDVNSFPAIALTIPDFEGEAILRIFANSTKSEIGCYSAVVTNGATFSQPQAVGSVLGIFTFVAMLASFATAAYGEAVPTMRLHYAHSLSVGVVFAVFQHIYYTGALSVNWPSVLVAWWSNFAWAGGMIHSTTMQNSINHLIGNNVGNTSEVGAAAAGTNQQSLGGGYDISQIYKRALSFGANSIGRHPLVRDIASEIYREPAGMFSRDLGQRSLEHTLQRRDLVNATTGYRYYGHPVGAGLPLPGNYSGFAGTLAQEGIRASNAFMTGFLWFLILLVLLVAALMAFKWVLEGFARLKWLKEGRFSYFRNHWLGYSGALALRICYLGFFMMMFLTIFQFTYQSSGGAKGVAAIVFIIFVVGVPGAAVYACLYKKAIEKQQKPRGLQVERKLLLGKIPWFGVTKAVANEQPMEMQAQDHKGGSQPFWKRMSTVGSITDQEGHLHSIHDNEDYTAKFGWLAARFRRTRWWFFTVWLLYEFVRAVFYGGASGYPLAQVFGLLVIEVLAFVFIVWARPFEGRRLNLLVVYCLGFSKVTSVALSAAFDLRFNLDRIITTAIGIIIIVIQGILTIITLIAIVVGAISSYMSVSRNREDFRPRKLAGVREKYFNHLDKAVNDLPPDPTPEPAADSNEPKEPYFEMKSVRRLAKIEDEDPDFTSEMRLHDPAASYLSLDQTPTPQRAESIRSIPLSGAITPMGTRRARASSVQSTTNLPYGARPHRPSWSTRDFDGGERSHTPIDMTRTVPDEPFLPPPPPAAKGAHGRKPSRSATLPVTSVRPQVSSDELRVGGDLSSHDTIGRVPAPSVRPRAGTYGSMRGGSRSNTPSFAEGGEASRSSDWLGELSYVQAPGGGSGASGSGSAGQKGGSRRNPLTPAQEQEEFMGLSPRVSRDQ
ncbi:hypothetical protein B0A55_06436 [Friedmanniomyces simplex]|uniref:ML-like domain-containing protein n=1 Tax=Friedmanniomyces simplex TaxID=329884 RepID=A0A4U0XCD7_9PEZI|nr:hypothetical protein B0A55_06436 [Friedmanniomyces simplex]